MKNTIARLVLVAAVSTLVPLADAEVSSEPTANSLDEIVVTATKTGAESVQKTPVAISVLSGEQLGSQGLNNTHDLVQFVPNVTYGQNTASAEIYIRGIGSNNVSAGSDPDVSTQVDGVYIARPAGQMSDFLDVDRVEVLRGPQGTLYGRNAVGGTINVISRKPSNTFSGSVALTGGDFGLGQLQAYVTGPLISERLQGSVALNYLRHEPYFTNIAGRDIGDADHGGGKVQLRWLPTSSVEAITRMDLSLLDENFESYSQVLAPTPFPSLANTVVGNYRTVAFNDPQMIRTKMGGVSEEINWVLPDAVSFKSISAWRATRYDLTNDNDSTEQFLQFSHQSETDSQFSQEFNLQYSRDRFKGVSGLYFFRDQDHQYNTVVLPPSVISPPARALYNAVSPVVKSTSGAVFAQGSFDLTEQLAIIVGARYTSENKQIDQFYERLSQNPATLGMPFPGFPVAFHLSNDYSAFTPKFGLDWQATQAALLYISATRGYKSGGFNFSAATPNSASFDPEKIWSYEAGAKTEWLDRQLRLNATVFYYDYKNLQVQQLIAAGVLSIGNAATAKVKGAELELTAKPVQDLQLTVNFSALDAKYDEYTGASVPAALTRFVSNSTCVGTACTLDASGNYLNAAPKYTALVAADYARIMSGLAWSAHVDYAWRDRAYFDPSNVTVMSQGPYGLVNAQVGLGGAGAAWRAQLWGKNLADTKYYVITSASGVTPNGLAGDPRTYGLRVIFDW
jgi:iron complex outermembrane receptor protein